SLHRKAIHRSRVVRSRRHRPRDYPDSAPSRRTMRRRMNPIDQSRTERDDDTGRHSGRRGPCILSKAARDMYRLWGRYRLAAIRSSGVPFYVMSARSNPHVESVAIKLDIKVSLAAAYALADDDRTLGA